MDDFILRALFAGILVAMIAGPLGCFVVWRRMAYFGDTLAHSALLGIAFGFLFDIHFQLAVIISCMSMALLLVYIESKQALSTDTILGILAHSALALGLVMLNFSNVQVDLMAYLFGDLLSVNNSDLLWLGAGVIVTLAILIYFWRSFLSITLHQELAQVEGLNVAPMRLLLMLLIAGVIALSMKIIGILLITSLLIIPPACARLFSNSPEKMAISSSLIGCISVCSGVFASFHWDTDTAPSIVLSATILFIISSAYNARKKSL